MAKRVVVKYGDYLHIDQFSELINTKRVSYYNLKIEEDGTLAIKFYDKKKKLVKPYAKK